MWKNSKQRNRRDTLLYHDPLLYPTGQCKTNKCPQSALPLLQPWRQLWPQHSALFSQNAPVCHSFCPSLVRYTRQCPETSTKTTHKHAVCHHQTHFMHRTERCFSISWLHLDLILCRQANSLIWFPDSDGEERKKERRSGGTPWHFLSCNHIFNS